MIETTNPANLIHKSVLLSEVLAELKPEKGKVYLDATFGLGGHTKAILDAEPTSTVIALDWDKNTLEPKTAELAKQYGDRLKIIWGNFSQLYKILKKNNIDKLDGILADFGTSQVQINSTDGLSFRHDTPLDMRMSKGHHFFTAEYVLNRYTEKNLAKIFFELSEERYARDIARAVVESRKTQPLKSTGQLADLVKKIYAAKQPHIRFRIHPATRVFQALRIYVNKELENIKSFLPAATQALKEGGKIVCISFHSLEDRIVKDFFRDNSHLLEAAKKPIVASPAEIEANPSSRSAKLRSAKKCSLV